MRRVKLGTTTRLRATPLLQVPNSNTHFYGVWGRIEFPVRNDDKIHTLTARDIINWPGLANDYYGNHTQAWVIWVANDIVDPWAVPVGTRLRIPSSPNVSEVIASITKDAE